MEVSEVLMCPVCDGELREVPEISPKYNRLVCSRQTCGFDCRKPYAQKVFAAFEAERKLTAAVHKAFGRGPTEQKQTVDQLVSDVEYLKRLLGDHFKARLAAESRAAALHGALSSVLGGANHKTIAEAQNVLAAVSNLYHPFKEWRGVAHDG